MAFPVPPAVVNPRKRSKYHNRPTTIDGERFDSQREADRWSELRLLERAGEIRNLRRQVSFTLHARNADRAAGTVGVYVADFVYDEHVRAGALAWELRVEDCKGMRTPLYVWKKKHMLAEYGIAILET